MALEQKTITLTQLGTDAGPNFSVQYSTDCVNYTPSPDCENVYLPTVGSSIVCSIDSNTACIRLVSLAEKCGNEVVKNITPTTSTTSTTLSPTTSTTLAPTTSTTLAPSTSTTLSPTTSTTLSPTTSTTTTLSPTTSTTTAVPTTTAAPTTSTTTVSCPECFEYEIANNSQVPGDTVNYYYFDCVSKTYQTGFVPYDSAVTICSCSTPVRTSGPIPVITNLGYCNGTTTTLSPTTSTSTTTLAPTGCYQWELDCPSGNPTGCIVNYTDCNGSPQTINVPDDTAGLICGRPTPSSTSATVTLVGTCVPPTTTTQPPTTTTTTIPCDSCDEYEIANNSQVPGDTLTVEYVDCNTRTVESAQVPYDSAGYVCSCNTPVRISGPTSIVITNLGTCTDTTTSTTQSPTTSTTTQFNCVTNFGAGMTPCFGGTVDDYMEAEVTLQNNVSVDTTFTMRVYYIPGTPLGNCNTEPTSSIDIDVTVPSGQNTYLVTCGEAPFIDEGGATICGFELIDPPFPVCSTTTTLTPTTTKSPTTTTFCPATIYTHGAVRVDCSDFCTTNYLIQTVNCADNDYFSLTIGDFIYGYINQAGYIAYSNVSTDTNTGPFRIAQIDGTGEVTGIFVCSGGSCVPL